MTPLSTDALEVNHAGRAAVVRRETTHPEQYLWIEVDGKQFFLGVLVPGMSRGAVKAMAMQWLEEHRS